MFESASVKASGSIAGNDGIVSTDPGRFVARNVTLKRLIHDAWRVPYAQIAGPPWLDRDEYNIEATTGTPVGAAQLNLMLQSLLTERFRLIVHRQREQRRVYVLTAVKGHLMPPAKEGAKPGLWRFHGDFAEFADALSVQLTIPLSPTNDPSIPSHAAGAAVPVVNQTLIEGVHDISLEIKPDWGAQADESVVRQKSESGDTFTVWQRALREQLGLRLESRKAGVDVLVISQADRLPTGN